MTARILDIPASDYYALDAFSSTRAKVVIGRSPLHAKCAREKDPSDILDRGNVIHRLVLGKGKDYAVIEANDWRTNKAKDERDAARKAGLVPVLADDFESHCLAAESVRLQLTERGIDLDGQSELAVEWDESGVLCKGMFDHVWLDVGIILDLKITDDASPNRIERTAENLGYAIQAAAYTRALAALRPTLAGRVKFLFAFCEPDEPYVINLCEPDGVFRELGERRWLRAVNTWLECLETGVYPAYGTGTNYLNPPPWALKNEGYSADDL